MCLLDAILGVVLASRIKCDAPHRAGMSIIRFERERDSDLSIVRSRQKPGHPVFLAHHALEERSVLSTETATPPRLAIAGVGLDVDVSGYI